MTHPLEERAILTVLHDLVVGCETTNESPMTVFVAGLNEEAEYKRAWPGHRVAIILNAQNGRRV